MKGSIGMQPKDSKTCCSQKKASNTFILGQRKANSTLAALEEAAQGASRSNRILFEEKITTSGYHKEATMKDKGSSRRDELAYNQRIQKDVLQSKEGW